MDVLLLLTVIVHLCVAVGLTKRRGTRRRARAAINRRRGAPRPRVGRGGEEKKGKGREGGGAAGSAGADPYPRRTK